MQSTSGLASLTPGGIQSKLLDMRTTLDIPEPLLEEARHVLGFKSKTDTVVLALRELVRKRRIEELKSLLGSVSLEIDIPKSRRRP
jgi:Arc/MetJ family transcription regulator